ncbi:MAG: chemotaxis protein CheW [Gammaproteobacteria bacterium]|jgi:chemotaxis signal transduction protein
MKSSESTPEVRDNALEFVIFVVGGDFFALPADSVIEVVDPPPVSPIPFMPAYVDGVVNVGGRVVPQIDLKQCLFDNVPGSNESGQVLLVDTAGPPCALAVERVVVLAEMAAEQVSRLTGATSSSREGEEESPRDDAELAGDDETSGQDSGERGRFLACEFNWDERTVVGLNPAALADLFDMVPIDDEQDGLLGREQAAAEGGETATTKFIVIGEADERYGIEVTQVLEIAEIEKFTRVPQAPAEIVGIGLLRQEPVLVLSLKYLLGGVASSSEGQKVLVVERAGTRYGLLVECIHGVTELPADAMRRAGDGRGLAGVLIDDEGLIDGWLDIEALIGDELHRNLRSFAPEHRQSEGERQIQYRRVLEVRIGRERFGLDIDSVQRVAEYREPEYVHDADKPWLVGVLDLEGEVVSLVDIGQPLGRKSSTEYGALVLAGDRKASWAVAVDQVVDILDLREDSIDEVDDSGTGYVKAVSVHSDRLISILTLDPLSNALHADGGVSP